MSGRVRRGFSAALAAIAGVVLLVTAVHRAETQPAPAKPPAPAQETAPEDSCKACHQPYFDTYAASKHGTKADPRAPANRGGCFTCHGAGALEHAQKGGGKGVGGVLALGSKAVAAETKNAVCLTCHQGGKRVHWSASTHANRDVSCTSCHQVHTAHDRTRDKLTQSETCFQ